MKKCWICKINDADSGEHVVSRAVLSKIIGSPAKDEYRFFTELGGKRNIPVKSLKNKRLKFAKSICQRCNDTLTQPYDEAFRKFVEKIFASKSLIISRAKISIGNKDSVNTDNLALYFLKILGCLIVDNNFNVDADEFRLIRNSLLSGTVQIDNVFLSAFRDIQKLEAKTTATVSQIAVIGKETMVWSLDLDWISIVLCYRFKLSKKHGIPWQFGSRFKGLKLGKIYKYD